MTTSQCERCGTSFESKIPTKRYCSRPCSKAAENYRRAQRTGHRNGHTGRRSPLTLDLRGGRISEHHSANDLGRYRRALSTDPCAYCGTALTEADHIVPLARGGTNDWDNYTAACAECNSEKSSRSLLAFLAWRPYREQYAQLGAYHAALAAIGPPIVAQAQRKPRTNNGLRSRNHKRLAA